MRRFFLSRGLRTALLVLICAALTASLSSAAGMHRQSRVKTQLTPDKLLGRILDLIQDEDYAMAGKAAARLEGFGGAIKKRYRVNVNARLKEGLDSKEKRKASAGARGYICYAVFFLLDAGAKLDEEKGQLAVRGAFDLYEHIRDDAKERDEDAADEVGNALKTAFQKVGAGSDLYDRVVSDVREGLEKIYPQVGRWRKALKRT